MNRLPVSSIAEFLHHVRDHSVDHNLLYRGQSRNDSLLPKISRYEFANACQTEQEMFCEFQRHYLLWISDRSFTLWDELSAAQHFGMATRLLDWTSNPLVAVWFACQGQKPPPWFVYLLMFNSSQLLIDHKSDPFTIAKTYIFRPRLNNHRVSAQAGWFTAHHYDDALGNYVALETNPAFEGRLIEFTINVPDRDRLLNELSLLGISYESMQRDLDGVCKDVNRKYLGPIRPRLS